VIPATVEIEKPTVSALTLWIVAVSSWPFEMSSTKAWKTAVG
jgi:hypothetical protein